MSTQEFETIAEGDPGLLIQVERIVVESHRRLYETEGREWSPPIAYRWLRYEDPMPVERLKEGVEKLIGLRASFDSLAVEKACAEAAGKGFSN